MKMKSVLEKMHVSALPRWREYCLTVSERFVDDAKDPVPTSTSQSLHQDLLLGHHKVHDFSKF